MYSTHLRDMYNFDPLEVERFLKEMRLLAVQGQTTAQAMKSKLVQESGASGAHAVGNGKGAANEAASIKTDDESNSQEEGIANNDTTGERQEGVIPVRGNPSRGYKRQETPSKAPGNVVKTCYFAQ